MKRWKFEVPENGQWVAGGYCASRERALGEAGHYATMYGQYGGDVKAIVWTGRKPRKPHGNEQIAGGWRCS